MKAHSKILALALAGLLCSIATTKQVTAQQPYVSFQVFYDQLSPYGQWVDYPNYGYVWLPDAGSDFVPYSSQGHWIMTEYGWTWASDYDWGWAPFHYGRWDYDDYYGWLWVPGDEWGPSWVTWRRANGYYGWEPMAPGMSINVSFGSQYNQYNDHWIFVRDRDIERSNINQYYVDRSVHQRIIIQSTVINTTYIDNSRHTTYVSGPGREEVQRVTGRKVSNVAIHENSKPGKDLRNGQLGIYRPQVNNERAQKSAPARTSELKDVKRSSERKPASQAAGTTPAKNNVRQQQPNSVKPQNNKSQPTRQPNAAPVNKNVRQQNTAQPQNNKVQPSPQRNPAPANNNVRQQQTGKQAKSSPQRNVAPAGNNARQQQPDKAAQPTQQRNAAPSNTNTGQRQQNTAKQQNKAAQPAQQRNTTPSSGNKTKQRNNSVSPSDNKNNDPHR
jgi:hypothetical protein